MPFEECPDKPRNRSSRTPTEHTTCRPAGRQACNSLAPWWGPTPRLPSLPQSITQYCYILNCSNKGLPPAHSNTANRSHPQQSARVHAAVHLGPLFLLGPQRSTATSYNCLPLKIMGKKWIWPSGFVWVSCTSQSTHQHSSSHSSST